MLRIALPIALPIFASILLVTPTARAVAPPRPAVKAPARPAVKAPVRPKAPVAPRPKGPPKGLSAPAPAETAPAEGRVEGALPEAKPEGANLEAAKPETAKPAAARLDEAAASKSESAAPGADGPGRSAPSAQSAPGDEPARPSPKAQAPGSDKPPAAGPDLARLRAEVQDVREQVFRSRARRETLGKALLSTQLLLSIEWAGGRRFTVKGAELRLDGVRVWEAGDGQLGDAPQALAPRSLAPGSHVLAVRAEVRPRDNPKLGYVTEQTFALDVAEGKKTRVEITVDEDGSPPSYNPDIEIDVEQD